MDYILTQSPLFDSTTTAWSPGEHQLDPENNLYSELEEHADGGEHKQDLSSDNFVAEEGDAGVTSTDHTESVDEAPSLRRIVILGKTGAGKSSVANTIFGEKDFKVYSSFRSGTRQCQAETNHISGRDISLIDTPGFFDTNTRKEELMPEILKCITMCLPGPHAFLIVLKYERFSELENEILNQITKHFSEEVFKYATIVFTHGEDLPEGQTIKDHLSHSDCLSEVVRKCGGRCYVIDSKYWNDSDDPYRNNSYQVNKILESVEEIVKENNGNCYTNEFLQRVEKLTKQAEQHKIPESIVKENNGNCHSNEMLQTGEKITQQEDPCHVKHTEKISKREIRERTEGKVWTVFKTLGISEDSLLKAFFGVKAAVAVAVACLVVAAGGKLAASAGVIESIMHLTGEETIVGAAGAAVMFAMKTSCSINK
ncbi:PREDICTED: GTPase IMAP family member 7-like [Cyprinodon variegatus]|uniref:GTPase IMAP family member 7-like n=1 Tax=Cyprinodon variegatus TaxID=28743 RepID=A0A3Q2CYF8_CYPVA|nr:PREDICTED: GTPase IMAP family member 7-like [Cyprinodon variegatus]